MASASVNYEPVDTQDFKSVFARADTDSSGADKDSPPPTFRAERHDELSHIFKLPSGETLVDDFICALRRRVLYQGRLYVFEHYACFYSHIFNHKKLLVIPLKDVTQIRKKKMYGFPNSIEIVWKGKRESFASFLKRDSAHRLLHYAWNKSTPYAKLFGEAPAGDHSPSTSPRAYSATDSKKVLGSVRLAKLVYRKGDAEPSPKTSPLSHEADLSDGDGEKVSPTPQEALETASEAFSHASDSDDESESAAEEGLENWRPVQEAATPPDPSMTLLTDGEFKISVQEFYKEFLSEQTQFLISWHEARGDTKVQLSEWHKHPMGHVRELTFITPLKQRIGPSKCLCTQTQRARLHPGNHLVFETSQIMDIPYGDHFAVEARWDVTSKGKGCKVEVRLAIPFSKKTIFRSTIESSTRALMKEAAEDWIMTAHRWLEPPIPIPMRSVFENQESSSGDDYKEPTHLTRSQSLAVRLSTNHVPDMDLLLRAPSASKADIARMLQLQLHRLETEQRLGSSLSRSRMKSVSFDLPGIVGPQSWSQRLRSRPALVVYALLSFIFLALAAAWLWPGLLDRSVHARQYVAGVLPRGDWLTLRRGQDLAPVTEQLRRLQTQLAALESSVAGLQMRVLKCEQRG